MIQTYTTQLVIKRQLTADVWHYRFSLLTPTRLEFIAGQYMILKIDDRGQRNYSILSPVSQKDSFDLLVQMIPNGLASTYLSAQTIGTKVIFQGPAGVFRLSANRRDKIFIATGTGIAPIKSIIDTHLKKLPTRLPDGQVTNNQLPNVYLYWGLRTRRDLYFVDELMKLPQLSPNFTFKICLSREENLDGLGSQYFAKGRINPNLMQFYNLQKTLQASRPQRLSAALAGAASFLPAGRQDKLHELINSFDYYICGARDIVESLRQFILSTGVIKTNIYFEKF